MGPLIHDSQGRRSASSAGSWSLLLLAMLLLPAKLVVVKMLPFDNKSEFQVIIDAPEGTTLEQTAAAARALSDYMCTVPEVTDVQSYVGTAGPYNFNGLVRHYFMRQGPNVADLQVNLVPKRERKRAQPHHRQDRARAADQDRREVRRADQGPRGAARPAGHVHAGGGGLRPDPRGAGARRPRDRAHLPRAPPAWWTPTPSSRASSPS